ncbi:hypothetical protein HAX54_021625, partial [Datura stramonium]|nr:hypothetical protein [Datura stramonium]
GFRPLLGIRVTSVVHGSKPAPHLLVAGGIVVCPVYCFALATQRRSADTIRRLTGVACSLMM